jgi:hypothetical protein
MKEAEIEFRKKFIVKRLYPPTGRVDLAVFKDFREELKIEADNIKAFLSPQRAVLFQKEPAPFTAKDMELRKRILELYPRDRITPIPIFFNREPEFEIAEGSENTFNKDT